MRKILSLIAGLGLAFALAANVSAATLGIGMSQEKQGTELVVTVTADGTLGATIVELEFDTDELSCTVDDIVMPTDTDYVAYECDVTDGVVSIGFVALDSEHAPKGTIATITFDIVESAQNKTASQFSIGLEQVDVVTLEEMDKIIADAQSTGSGSGNGNGSTGGSSNSGSQSGNESTVVKLDEETIADAVAEIEEKLQDSDGSETVVVTIDMKKENGDIATEVPVEILEAIQGKNVEVVFDMGEYSWTINGEDLTEEELEAINLEVILDGNAIDKELVDAIAEGRNTYQFSMTHEGKLGFNAALSFNVGSENKGLLGSLYRLENGKLVLAGTATIDENGDVTFDVSEGADYVVVIGEVEEDESSDEDDTKDPSKDDNEPVDTTPEAKVPWGLILGIVAVVVVVAGVGAFVFMRRK